MRQLIVVLRPLHIQMDAHRRNEPQVSYVDFLLISLKNRAESKGFSCSVTEKALEQKEQ
jgi:hypothetical protein